ncbi:MAG: hypothetical protein JWM93_610, partial [Frankiales bacterium]|nr:hypothetical protein [Frankiales bacterium]
MIWTTPAIIRREDESPIAGEREIGTDYSCSTVSTSGSRSGDRSGSASHESRALTSAAAAHPL